MGEYSQKDRQSVDERYVGLSTKSEVIVETYYGNGGERRAYAWNENHWDDQQQAMFRSVLPFDR